MKRKDFQRLQPLEKFVYRLKNDDGTTEVHHLIPRSMGGSNEPKNLIRLRRNMHLSLHRLFGTMAPKELLIALLAICKGVIREDILEQFRMILRKPDDEFYN